ncbi:hypothetical protein GLE_1815 [Lysobacter enzymogenes]|uniref:Uncharacterized protein n=1 Tax=Lysobacter enzymogenes TaxID=69 RepID=A0A0S2DFW6_LYSEN|nr:hypothetical protein GLE_1815 [Lysobacter enzymogenes]
MLLRLFLPLSFPGKKSDGKMDSGFRRNDGFEGARFRGGAAELRG